MATSIGGAAEWRFHRTLHPREICPTEVEVGVKVNVEAILERHTAAIAQRFRPGS